MAAIDQLVKVTITEQSPSVSQESFAVPLIVGPTKPAGRDAGDVVRTYFDPADLLGDGYSETTPEYVMAAAIYSQDVTPTEFKVGTRSGQSAAQKDEVKVGDTQVGQMLTIGVENDEAFHTVLQADTPQSILEALGSSIAALAPVTAAVTGTGATAKLTLTAKNAGDVISYRPGMGLAVTSVAAAKGIVADLAAILAKDSTWYGLCIANATDAEILQAAAWVEANLKLYVAVSSTDAIATGAEDDLASKLQDAGYTRTALLFTKVSADKGIDAAWLASQISLTPGSASWAFKRLAGIPVDVLTPSQQSALIGSPVAGVRGKNANIYQTVSGASITQMGTAASGRYLDITHGLDWLKSQIRTNVYSLLVSVKKVPYTDGGVTMLQSAVRAAIDLGVDNGLIDGSSPISVTAPLVATVPANQRAGRVAPPITFACRQQGALHAVNIQGTLSV